MLVLPLTTPRLIVRMMREPDTAALLAYRNDPAVARYQEWPLPYTAAMAAELIGAQTQYDSVPDDPTMQTTMQGMVQLAIERNGDVIGDVAVGLFDSARQANIGYSIMTSEQGNGYATEAVGAVVAALFDEARVHRIVASTDPANAASQRVLVKLGFRFEGRAVSAAFVRGQWVDDDRFALLESYPRTRAHLGAL